MKNFSRTLLVIVVIIIVALIAWFAWMKQSTNVNVVENPNQNQQATTTSTDTNNNPAPQPIKTDMIEVDAPLPSALVSSPLVVTGRARGGWYFEASFPVKLIDANGKVLAEGPAQAQGDWMTSEFVPFKITLTFSKPSTQTGTLILHNDNPSGLPQNDKEVRIPVTFN
jgi:hypothetical protein